jgi:hypothetical protein
MKKSTVIAGSCVLALALVAVSGCGLGGGAPVSLEAAREAFSAVQSARTEADLIAGGVTEGVTWVDNGTVGADMKRISSDGTVAIEVNPTTPGVYPAVITYTFTGYNDPGTGYAVYGEVVYVADAQSMGSDNAALDLSGAGKIVRTMDGLLTRSGYFLSGSYSFNGVCSYDNAALR